MKRIFGLGLAICLFGCEIDEGSQILDQGRTLDGQVDWDHHDVGSDAAPDIGPDAAPDIGAVPVPDVGPDAAPDVGPDAAPDVGPDAAPDAAPDLGPDAAPDLGPDAAPDLGPDAAPDLGPDAAPDLGPDAAPDLGPDAAHDVGPDAAPDVGADAEPDLGPECEAQAEASCLYANGQWDAMACECTPAACPPMTPLQVMGSEDLILSWAVGEAGLWLFDWEQALPVWHMPASDAPIARYEHRQLNLETDIIRAKAVGPDALFLHLLIFDDFSSNIWRVDAEGAELIDTVRALALAPDGDGVAMLYHSEGDLVFRRVGPAHPEGVDLRLWATERPGSVTLEPWGEGFVALSTDLDGSHIARIDAEGQVQATALLPFTAAAMSINASNARPVVVQPDQVWVPWYDDQGHLIRFGADGAVGPTLNIGVEWVRSAITINGRSLLLMGQRLEQEAALQFFGPAGFEGQPIPAPNLWVIEQAGPAVVRIMGADENFALPFGWGVPCAPEAPAAGPGEACDALPCVLSHHCEQGVCAPR